MYAAACNCNRRINFCRGAGDGGNRGGFANSSDGAEQQDGGGAIGTWTNETEANPKTDSWGEVWAEEDNQWTGN